MAEKESLLQAFKAGANKISYARFMTSIRFEDGPIWHWLVFRYDVMSDSLVFLILLSLDVLNNVQYESPLLEPLN